MKKLITVPILIILAAGLFAQQNSNREKPQKYALVIGNGAYTGLSRLANPVNDANDMAAALQDLGFTVDKIVNGNLDQMENAIARLKNRLSTSKNSYGFFFYAGHGVQSGGENYLIPVDANIPSESYLRNRSLSVQIILDDLNEARNSLNVVVLDACRDNPFGWSRAGNRGLAMITRQPADSIIVYATSAGQQASDGDGDRNGLFTGQLINNLSDQSIDVNEVFRRTGADVSEVSERRQIPAIYNQFFGIAYLGNPGEIAEQLRTRPATRPLQPAQSGRDSRDRTQLWTVGASVGTAFAAPLFIGTIHGTIAPLRHSFLELGVDLGLASGDTDVGYYSINPYVHYAFFMPFANKGGWYIGAGGGYIISQYDFPGEKVPVNYPVAAVTVGVNLLNIFDVSWSLRTNFRGVSQKVSAGWTYRF